MKKYAAVTLGLAFVIVNWMSTQHAARLIGQTPQQGPGLFWLPWLGLVYAPWKWMGWAWQWWWSRTEWRAYGCSASTRCFTRWRR